MKCLIVKALSNIFYGVSHRCFLFGVCLGLFFKRSAFVECYNLEFHPTRRGSADFHASHVCGVCVCVCMCVCVYVFVCVCVSVFAYVFGIQHGFDAQEVQR